MIPQWSLSGAIRPGLHCSAFRCHHASFRETSLGFVSMILLWTWLTRVTHLMMDDLMSFDFFRFITHLMPYWGIFPFRSRFIYPQELFLGYQDRPDASDAILGHISFLQLKRWWFSPDLLQFSSLDREILYLHYWSLSLWFSSRWAFDGVGRSGCDCLAIRDSSADCCIEIALVTLSDHFSRDSLEDHLIWSPRLASRASFETHGVSFRSFQGIEICGSMLYWGIFPLFITSSHLQLGIQSHHVSSVLAFRGIIVP